MVSSSALEARVGNSTKLIDYVAIEKFMKIVLIALGLQNFAVFVQTA